MRIGFVTQWFPPEPGFHLAESTATGFAARGHEVHVLTGFPNYPGGKLHAGYPLRPYREDHYSDGVTVHRAPIYPSHDASALRRFTNYASFAVASTAIALRRIPKPDVWLTYSSPATAGTAASVARRIGGAPSCLVIQDLWPDSVVDSGMMPGWKGSAARRVLNHFCDFTYRSAAGIGVISPSMRHILTARGVPDTKIFDTPNWSPDNALNTNRQSSVEMRRTLCLPTTGRLFMYVGNLGYLQGIEDLVDAFATIPDAQFVIIGDGVRRAAIEHKVSAGIPNVHVLGPRSFADVGRFIAASDVQVVSLQDTPLLRATMPSKVQISLAGTRPVLAHAAGDVAELIQDQQLGAVAPPGRLSESRSAIRSLVAASEDDLVAMGRRSRFVYESRFTAQHGLDRLEGMLETVLDGRPSDQDSSDMRKVNP